MYQLNEGRRHKTSLVAMSKYTSFYLRDYDLFKNKKIDPLMLFQYLILIILFILKQIIYLYSFKHITLEIHRSQLNIQN